MKKRIRRCGQFFRGNCVGFGGRLDEGIGFYFDLWQLLCAAKTQEKLIKVQDS